MDLHIRLPRDLGCTMCSTTVLKALKDTFPEKKVVVFTHLPDLVEGLPFIDGVRPVEDFIPAAGSLDLRNYTEERNVLEAKPYRHLIDHMFEAAEEAFGIALDRRRTLYFELSEHDREEAQKVFASLDRTKPVVWTRKKTSKTEKDLPVEFWQELESLNKDRYTFLELDERYPKRVAMALTALCDAGIVLDTFLSHGSQAAGAKNVVLLLVSTRPEVVSYPNQHVLGPDEKVAPEMVTKKLMELV